MHDKQLNKREYENHGNTSANHSKIDSFLLKAIEKAMKLHDKLEREGVSDPSKSEEYKTEMLKFVTKGLFGSSKLAENLTDKLKDEKTEKPKDEPALETMNIFMELDMTVFCEYNFNMEEEVAIDLRALYPNLTEEEVAQFPYATLPVLSPITWISFLSLLEQSEKDKINDLESDNDKVDQNNCENLRKDSQSDNLNKKSDNNSNNKNNSENNNNSKSNNSNSHNNNKVPVMISIMSTVSSVTDFSQALYDLGVLALQSRHLLTEKSPKPKLFSETTDVATHLTLDIKRTRATLSDVCTVLKFHERCVFAFEVMPPKRLRMSTLLFELAYLRAESCAKWFQSTKVNTHWPFTTAKNLRFVSICDQKKNSNDDNRNKNYSNDNISENNYNISDNYKNEDVLECLEKYLRNDGTTEDFV